MRVVVRLLLYLLAIGCFAYSGIVAKVRSGSKFFLFWDVAGIVLVLIAVAVRMKLWTRLGRSVRVAVICVAIVGIGLFVTLLGMILSEYRQKDIPEVDYVIVLGAQMRDYGPSVVLQFRLDRAVEYLNVNKTAMCVVSGGQGANEPCTEAEGMERYLISRGIAADRIIREDKSTNTKENLEFSAKLIPEDATVGILTSNFHVKRALYLAGRTGFEDPVGIVAPSSRMYVPNNLMREVLGLAKDIIVN